MIEWLKNFYDYEFLKGRPNRIQIKEIVGDYQPLPRKPPKQDVSKEQSYYKKAKERFEEKYGSIPILVSEWRLKR